MSGLASEVLPVVGIVAGGESDALHVAVFLLGLLEWCAHLVSSVLHQNSNYDIHSTTRLISN